MSPDEGMGGTTHSGGEEDSYGDGSGGDRTPRGSRRETEEEEEAGGSPSDAGMSIRILVGWTMFMV